MKTKEEIIEELYLKLEAIRKDTGKSMADFCKPIGKGQNWYQQNHKDKRDIPYADLIRLLEYWNKSIDDI